MSTAEIQKHLHLYINFSSVTFVCIIGTLKNGLVLAFYTGVTSHCRSLFSCFLVCVEIRVPPRVDNTLFHNPVLSTPAALSCRASASASSPCMAWWGQGSSLWRPSCAMQQGPSGTASTPPSPVMHGSYISKDSQQEQKHLKTHVIWSQMCRIVSHICRVCVAPLQCTAHSKCVGEDARTVFASSCCNFLLVFSAELGI